MGNEYYEQELVFGNDSQTTMKRKAIARLMSLEGIEKAKIASVIGITQRQVYNYMKEYEIADESEGYDVYEDIRYRPVSEMKAYEEEILSELTERPPATAKEAAKRIEELTGLKRSPTQVRKLMHELGLRVLKTAQIPAKADAEEQREFLTTQLEPRIEEAKKGERVLLFMDASHFVWQVYLGVLWCLTRIFVRAASGRKRINVLGALDPITKELTKIVNKTYITSATVCELLIMLALKYKGRQVTVVLDNASYQRCDLVKETAARLKIELLFLPTYSPNLNLIERLWRYVKNECLYNEYYETSKEFEDKIVNCLEQINTTRKNDVDSLITLKFQMYDDSPIAKSNSANKVKAA